MPDNMKTDFARALKRAEINQKVEALLDELPLHDRRTVAHDQVARCYRRVPASALQVSASAPKPPPRSGRGPAGRRLGAGLTDKLVKTLRAQPRSPVEELSTAVYGDAAPEHRKKTRALLHNAKVQGRVRSLGEGRWEAV